MEKVKNQMGEYLKKQGLEFLLKLDDQSMQRRLGVFDGVRGIEGIPFPPDYEDLVRLHKLVRQRKCFTILEFGVGYSTIVLADALRKNEEDWNSLANRPEIRNRFMFEIFSVDTSLIWLEKTKELLPKGLVNRTHLIHTGVTIGTYHDQLCHYYDLLPDVIADFIYVDGPFAKDVKGDIRGMTFACEERTVMSADLLLMEPTFLPGTFILIDGRTNNARFLQRNFKRTYSFFWDKEADLTTFELTEERLGKYNVIGSDFF